MPTIHPLKIHSRRRLENCLAAILTVLLIVADCYLGRALVQQANTREYISTPGAIIATSTADFYEKTRNLDPGMSYTYSVGGHKYLSHHDKFIWLPGDRTDDALHDLPAGCMVEVFYDPTNPRQAVLVRGLEHADLGYATLLFLINLFVLGYWMLTGGRLRISDCELRIGGGANQP